MSWYLISIKHFALQLTYKLYIAGLSNPSTQNAVTWPPLRKLWKKNRVWIKRILCRKDRDTLIIEKLPLSELSDHTFGIPLLGMIPANTVTLCANCSVRLLRDKNAKVTVQLKYFVVNVESILVERFEYLFVWKFLTLLWKY